MNIRMVTAGRRRIGTSGKRESLRRLVGILPPCCLAGAKNRCICSGSHGKSVLRFAVGSSSSNILPGRNPSKSPRREERSSWLPAPTRATIAHVFVEAVREQGLSKFANFPTGEGGSAAGCRTPGRA
jgi:hypothetical protein